MRIARTLVGDPKCPQGWDCPHIHQTEAGDLVAQGYVLRGDEAGDVAPGQAAVRLPGWMCEQVGVTVSHYLDDGWAVVIGTAVTDSEMLQQMEMATKPREAVVYTAREETYA